MVKFGENVKQYRKARKLTQNEFANLLSDKLKSMGMNINYNNKSVSMWENGERVPDNAIVWVAVSELLNITIDTLLKGECGTIAVSDNNQLISGSFMDSVNYEYVKQFIENDKQSNLSLDSIADIFINIDSYDDNTETAHAMLLVLSTVDIMRNSKTYNIESTESTYDYLRKLHTRNFIKESEFLKELGINGIKDCPYAYSKKITDFYGSYLEIYNMFSGYDCNVMYDNDFSHVLTVVDCEYKCTKDMILATMARVYAEGTQNCSTIYKAMLANSKTILGMKYAKDKWYKSK